MALHKPHCAGVCGGGTGVPVVHVHVTEMWLCVYSLLPFCQRSEADEGDIEKSLSKK